MDEALIVVAVISGLFSLAGLQLLTHNWFRKERFKLETWKVKEEGKIKLNSLRKELNISPQASHPQEAGNGLLGLFGSLPPSVQKNVIGALAGNKAPSIEEDFIEEPGGDDIVSKLLKIGQENPELAKSFLDGIGNTLSKGKNGGSNYL